MQSFYILRDGEEVGPYTSKQLKRLGADGEISSQTFVRLSGGSWVKAGKIKGLVINEKRVDLPPKSSGSDVPEFKPVDNDKLRKERLEKPFEVQAVTFKDKPSGSSGSQEKNFDWEYILLSLFGSMTLFWVVVLFFGRSVPLNFATALAFNIADLGPWCLLVTTIWYMQKKFRKEPARLDEIDKPSTPFDIQSWSTRTYVRVSVVFLALFSWALFGAVMEIRSHQQSKEFLQSVNNVLQQNRDRKDLGEKYETGSRVSSKEDFGLRRNNRANESVKEENDGYQKKNQPSENAKKLPVSATAFVREMNRKYYTKFKYNGGPKYHQFICDESNAVITCDEPTNTGTITVLLMCDPNEQFSNLYEKICQELIYIGDPNIDLTEISIFNLFVESAKSKNTKPNLSEEFSTFLGILPAEDEKVCFLFSVSANFAHAVE